MKGFPNQINDLKKIVSAFHILVELSDAGKDPTRDDVFGETLVRRGVTNWRDKSLTVDQYIAAQRKKDSSYRSYETSARGLRELFRLMGAMVETDSGLVITPKGQVLRGIDPNTLGPSQLADLGKIIRGIELTGANGNVSHPYQVLLRLVARCPKIDRTKSPLAFEATDDSDNELERLIKLSKFDQDTIRKKIGETKSNWENAKKILPSFAEQLGDVKNDGGALTIAKAPAVPTGERIESKLPTKRQPRRGRRASADTIGRAATHESFDENYEFDATEKNLRNLQEGIETRRTRLRRHNLIVQKVAAHLEAKGWEIYEDPYDCLGIGKNVANLVEVKTLDGTENDEVERVREALAQLLYYESFAISPQQPDAVIRKIAIFEGKINENHIAWLTKMGIGVAWICPKGIDAPNSVRSDFSDCFDFS